MLTATTKAKNWKAVTAALSPLAEEAVLRFEEGGIRCAALDPSHTEGIGFYWKSSGFEKYELVDATVLDVPINIEYFVKVVKRFADDSNLTITTKHIDIAEKKDPTTGAVVTQEEKHKLVGFVFTDRVKKFDCSLYIGETTFGQLPNISYVNRFEMELSKMEEMMDDCKVFGIEVCTFKEEDGKLIYYATEAPGNLKGVMVERFDMELAEIGFNFTFMEPVLKSLKPYLGKNISVEFFERAPIRLSFDISDVCVIQYYLAPTIK